MLEAVHGRVLWSRNADARMFPASLTKMVTTAVALEAGDLDREVEISAAAAAVPHSSIALEAGERMTLRELVAATMIWSANDAAFAVGEAVAGSMDGFLEMMNRRAREWGAHNTQFENPHGLHSEGHYTTARDMGAIALGAMAVPGFRELATQHAFTMLRPVYLDPEEDKENPGRDAEKVRTYEPREFQNRNRLLRDWDECDGIKTGYTRAAGRCLASAASRGGWQAVGVVLKSGSIWDDSRKLLEWAFEHHGLRRVVQAGQGGWMAPVRDGKAPEVPLVAAEAVDLVLPLDAPDPELRPVVEPLEAPVTRGQRAGRLDVVVDGEVRAQVPLLAAQEVELSLWGQVKRLTLPPQLGQGLLILAAGVLLLGTAAKTARARRGVLTARRGGTDHPGPRDGGWRGRDATGRPRRPFPARDRR